MVAGQGRQNMVCLGCCHPAPRPQQWRTFHQSQSRTAYARMNWVITTAITCGRGRLQAGLHTRRQLGVSRREAHSKDPGVFPQQRENRTKPDGVSSLSGPHGWCCNAIRSHTARPASRNFETMHD